MKNRIVILGGGVGGLSLARALRFVAAHITLVDRGTSHVFPSHLYAAAVGRPSAAIPYSSLLRGQTNVELVQNEAVHLDAARRRLILTDQALPYDILVVATGSRPRYLRAEWERFAPSLKSAGDAARIRERLQDRDTTVVVAGGGTTGVELAAAVAHADRARRVVIVEEEARLLTSFPEELAQYARRRLLRLGVEIRHGLHAIGMDATGVRFSGPQGREQIGSSAILWAAGVEGSAFGVALAHETRVPLDDLGRVCVKPDLTIPGYPEIFVIGDLARCMHEGRPLDGLATIASQQGRYVAATIRERMAAYTARGFEYVDQGRFAILGRTGIGVLGDTQLRGTAAWMAAKLAHTWSSPHPILRLPPLAPEMRAYARW